MVPRRASARGNRVPSWPRSPVLDSAQALPPAARDLVHRIPEALLPDDDLECALALCEVNREEHLPVVDNRRDQKVIGEVRYQDLVLAYNRALLAARAAERGEV